MTNTRPPVNDPEALAKWISEHQNRGAKVTVQDPRVSSFVAWAAVVLGGLATTAIVWGASSVVELNKQVAILAARPEPATKEQMEWLSERIKRLEERK